MPYCFQPMKSIKKFLKSQAFIFFIIANILFGLSTLIAYYISFEKDKLILPIDRFEYALNNENEFTHEEIEAVNKISFERVAIEDIPEDCINSIIVIEDKTFRTNNGIDKNGVARLIYTALPLKNDLGGGSTISQQLIKMYQDRYYKRTPYDKLKEMVWAFRLTQSFSKDEILEMYLNNVYLGDYNYGIGAASNAYFNKDVRDLNKEECAYIMALPQSPNTYIHNQSKWDERKDRILELLSE